MRQYAKFFASWLRMLREELLVYLCETNWQCVFGVAPCGLGRAKVNVENAFGAHVSRVILSLELPSQYLQKEWTWAVMFAST